MRHDAIAAALSRDVYLDRIPFERACMRLGVTPADWYDHAGTQAALVRSPEAAWLVFRGTEASRLRWIDIAANVKVWPRPWAGDGWAHSGYADALERIRYGARRLAETVSTEIPLYAVGHSLGGALASAYTAWVAADYVHGHRLAGLITFGAPKCGTAAAMAPIARRGWPVRRYVMPGDAAPLWPLGLYSHPAPAIRLAPLDHWPGPVSRHSVDRYATAVALQT